MKPSRVTPRRIATAARTPEITILRTDMVGVLLSNQNTVWLIGILTRERMFVYNFPAART
jgi:hypothetical protein